MQLERLSATIRPRTPWESIDLGFALARRWFLPLWALWWVTALPIGALLLLPLHDRPDLWALTLWWFKPLFEALLLLWLSRALFAEQASVPQMARQLPLAFPRRLWPHLLWRRLALARSFTMPLTLLERLTGSARRERLQVLGRRNGAASWLTIVCVHLEAVLWLSALLVLAFLIPEHLPNLDLRSVLFDDQSLAYWIGTLCALATMSLIAPFYVAAGFALYLGRRTELEAWDLELLFRQRPVECDRRDNHGRSPGTKTTKIKLPALTFCLVLAGGFAQPAPAQTPAERLENIPTPDQAKALIETLLAGEDFGSTREEDVWVYVGENGGDDRPAEVDPPGWLPLRLIIALAEAAKWVIAALAMAALGLILYRLLLELRDLLNKGQHGRRSKIGARATVISDGAARHDLLPADIPNAVRALLAASEARAALALLYRAQIAHLRALGLDIPDSATEGDCLNAAARVGTEEQLNWLRRLMALWQTVAYAHRPVDRDAIGQLLATRPIGQNDAAHEGPR